MGAGRDSGGVSTTGGWSESERQAALRDVADAVDRLGHALTDVGLPQAMRESASCNLRSLDRGLPNEPLEELLLSCEAYATVTAPAALATNDLAQVRDEGQYLLHDLQALAGAGRGRNFLANLGNTLTGTQNVFLRSALGEPDVQDALADLIDALSPLAALAGGETITRKRLLPAGKRLFIPVVVLGGAIMLVIILLSSISFATGLTLLPSGLELPIGSNKSGAQSTATAVAQSGRPTPTTASARATATPAAGPQPTATTAPGSAPTATPPPSSPKFTVSPTSLQACFDAPATLTISYAGGSQPTSWTASWSDHANIGLSPSSGSLSPGRSANVTVSLLVDQGVTGTITITPSNGLGAGTVTYDSSNC
jgi:hypothetical protein